MELTASIGSITSNELEGLGDVAAELVSVWNLDVGHDGAGVGSESGTSCWRTLYEKETSRRSSERR